MAIVRPGARFEYFESSGALQKLNLFNHHLTILNGELNFYHENHGDTSLNFIMSCGNSTYSTTKLSASNSLGKSWRPNICGQANAKRYCVRSSVFKVHMQKMIKHAYMIYIYIIYESYENLHAPKLEFLIGSYWVHIKKTWHTEPCLTCPT